MHDALETYLEEIGRFLAGTEGADEILAEIRSHILEKAETEFGEVTETALSQTIAGYGSPRAVAEPYLEGNEIISPVFRRHFFRYLSLLVGFHLVLVVIAFVTKASLFVIPFFYVPEMNVATALIYVPMAFVYDFGLVAFFFFLVTRRKKDLRLPWPRPLRPDAARFQLRPPRVSGLVALIAFFGVSLYFYLRFHTIFFYTVNLHRPISLLDPTSSLVYSGLFLAAIACEACCYALRFVRNSILLRVLRDVAILLLLWTAWNVPIQPEFRPVDGFDTKVIGTAFVFLLIVVVVGRFLWDLALVTRARPLGRATS